MKRRISRAKRLQLEEGVVTCRALEREIASWHRWMVRELGPVDDGEWNELADAFDSVITNERHPLSKVLRRLGIRTSGRRARTDPTQEK
jgi:hypothetical protein